MKEKLHDFKELINFIKESKKEYPDLKRQFELYINDKKKYEETRDFLSKDQKRNNYGVKYK